jgi:hypothetical protein
MNLLTNPTQITNMEKKYTPCGGCGATEPIQRCIGCFHPFEAFNPELLKVMQEAENTKEDDLKKVKEEVGKCPECGAPCKLIDRTYQEEIHDVHYTEHVYQPPAEAGRGKGPVWVRASEYKTDKPIFRPYRRKSVHEGVDYDYGEIFIELQDDGQLYLDVDNENNYTSQSHERWNDYDILDESGENNLHREISRRNKLLEDDLKRQCRLNMPGISEVEQDQAWQDYKLKHQL